MSQNQLEITRGDTKVFTSKVTVVDKALAGATIRMMCRRGVDGTVVISKSLSSGIAITSDVANNREIQVTFLPADTAMQSKTVTLDYDLEIVYADGYVATVETGQLTIKADVTR